MSWTTEKVWYGDNDVRVVKQRQTGVRARRRYQIFASNDTRLSINEFDLFNLAELLDDICDEVEDNLNEREQR